MKLVAQARGGFLPTPNRVAELVSKMLSIP